MKDYFKVLGIRKNASIIEAKKAYRRLSMIYHPDRGFNAQKNNLTSEQSEEKFVEITEAYKVLSDSAKRARYINNKSLAMTEKPREYMTEIWNDYF